MCNTSDVYDDSTNAHVDCSAASNIHTHTHTRSLCTQLKDDKNHCTCMCVSVRRSTKKKEEEIMNGGVCSTNCLHYLSSYMLQPWLTCTRKNYFVHLTLLRRNWLNVIIITQIICYKWRRQHNNAECQTEETTNKRERESVSAAITAARRRRRRRQRKWKNN